jgi:hypothetical protein
MKTFALTAVALTSLAAAPLSALDLGMEADVDGSGTYSLEELQTAFPELTEDVFVAIDVNADGVADKDEVQAAVDAGVLSHAG